MPDTHVPRYRWATAYEWLMWKYGDELDNGICNLLQGLDSDTIQEECQSEMDDDGYFDDLDAPSEEEETEDDDA